jgi:hypothetical protein
MTAWHQMNQQQKMVFINTAMHSCNFDRTRSREWLVWGAKHRACPKCGVDAWQRCENLASRKRNKVEYTVFPHQERIDYDRIRNGLKQRGYIT